MKAFAVLPVLASSAAAWGAFGHEITATIAQMLLTEPTRAKVCDILPGWTKCHLAAVAPWADEIKANPWWRSWSSALHYVDPHGDWPSKHCSFGDEGWESPDRNILLAISNYTKGVAFGSGQEQDYALRFLVHFLGDLHQPMHLTGRERGGNNIKVEFDGKSTNLHSVWDDDLLEKNIRDTKNYTEPLPEDRIERALQGKEYDPYIRYIAKEGLLGWWREEYTQWPDCPLPAETSESQLVMGAGQSLLGGSFPTLPDDPALPSCPHYWASLHQVLNCDIVFPSELDKPNPHNTSWLTRLVYSVTAPREHHMELDIPEYSGKIQQKKIIEKQLALGGVRLAAILNKIFDPSSAEDRRSLAW